MQHRSWRAYSIAGNPRNSNFNHVEGCASRKPKLPKLENMQFSFHDLIDSDHFRASCETKATVEFSRVAKFSLPRLSYYRHFCFGVILMFSRVFFY